MEQSSNGRHPSAVQLIVLDEERLASLVAAVIEERLAALEQRLLARRTVEEERAGESLQPLLGQREVSELLSVDPRTVRNWTRDPDLYDFPRPVYVGRSPRWYAREVSEWLARRTG